ncbi:MAG: acyl carrier protein [Nitrospiraceae bacterium]
MNASAAIAPRIHQALADYVKRDVHTIAPGQSLREDLGLDSMATIELLFRIEEAFDLQIPDGDLHKLVTVGDVTAYVERRLSPTPAAAPGKPAPTGTTAKPAKRAKKKLS